MKTTLSPIISNKIQTQKVIHDLRIKCIMKQLDNIDLKSVRPLRSIWAYEHDYTEEERNNETNKTIYEQDQAKITEFNTQAKRLRTELAELNNM